MHVATQTLLAYVFEAKIRITISITRDGVKDASGLLLIHYIQTRYYIIILETTNKLTLLFLRAQSICTRQLDFHTLPLR
jgi:hypothetical protein